MCLGGLIKHVTLVENRWVSFIEEGPSAIGGFDPAALSAHTDSFRMQEDESLAGLLGAYGQAAERTEAVVMGLDSLSVSHPLPEAPWFEAGASWSARRVLLHILAETAQHAGHADILRESVDGARAMG